MDARVRIWMMLRDYPLLVILTACGRWLIQWISHGHRFLCHFVWFLCKILFKNYYSNILTSSVCPALRLYPTSQCTIRHMKLDMGASSSLLVALLFTQLSARSAIGVHIGDEHRSAYRHLGERASELHQHHRIATGDVFIQPESMHLLSCCRRIRFTSITITRTCRVEHHDTDTSAAAWDE